MNTKVNLVLATDERYLAGLLATIGSIAVSSSTPNIQIYVLDGGLSENAQAIVRSAIQKFKLSYKPIFIPINSSLFDHFPSFFFDSKMLYARLLIPQLIHEPKVIYIDTDILCTKDIKQLWDLPLENKSIGAALEYVMPTIGMDCPNYKDLNIDPSAPYFNSGLLVLDLDKIREKDLMTKALIYLQEYKHFCKYHDQTALNVVFYGDFYLLEQSWNVQSHKESFDLIRDYRKLKGGINYHFVTKNKPWLFYSNKLPNKMFLSILDYIKFNYQSETFKKSAFRYTIKSKTSAILPAYYKIRSFMLRSLGRNVQKEQAIIDFWKTANHEKKGLQIIRKEMDELLYWWNLKFKS